MLNRQPKNKESQYCLDNRVRRDILADVSPAVTIFGSARTAGDHKTLPFVLVGSSFRSGLIGWMREQLLAEGKIGTENLLLFEVFDEVDEIVNPIRKVLIV